MSKDTIRAGIKTVLEAANTALHVYKTEAPEDPEFPALVLFNGDDDRITVGASYLWRLPCRLYLHSGSPDEGWAEIDKYLEPTGTESIDSAIDGDRPLNGSADTSKLGNPIGEGKVRDPNADGSQDLYSVAITFSITS